MHLWVVGGMTPISGNMLTLVDQLSVHIAQLINQRPTTTSIVIVRGLFFTLLLFTHLLYMKLFCYYCAMYRDFVTPLICELNCRSWLLSYKQINQKWFLHKILRDMTYFIIIYVGGETWNIKIDRFSSMLVTWSTASFHICFACDHKIMTFSHKNDGKACRHDIVKLYYSDVVCAQFSARWRLKVLSRTSHFIQID